MDHEMESFQKDLLASVRQMKAGKVARTTEVKLSAAAEARAKVGLSQSAFAQLLGISVFRTGGIMGVERASSLFRYAGFHSVKRESHSN